MGLTDHCDIFAALHEDGLNNVISHVMQQRPSLFNYATADVAKNIKLLCQVIKVHRIVVLRENPLVTIVDPLPIPGTNYGLNFAVQLVSLTIDLHPGDEFNLPPELNPPLKKQRLAIKLRLCGGIGCPPDGYVDELIPPPQSVGDGKQTGDRKKPSPREDVPVTTIPTRSLNCFCLDAYATGGVKIVNYGGDPYLEPYLEGFEIVDIKPAGLENSIECYVKMLLKLSVLPGLRFLLRHAPLNLTQGATDYFSGPTNITLSPTPVGGAINANPAIEDDSLKVYINVEVS